MCCIRLLLSCFVLLITFLTTSAQVDLSRGLVAYYPLNGNATDISGNGLNGLLLNGVTATNDRFNQPGSALSFDGIDDYVEIPDNVLLRFRDSFSITFLFSRDASSTVAELIEKRDWIDGSKSSFDIGLIGSGQVRTAIKTGSLCDDPINGWVYPTVSDLITPDRWYCVATTFNKGEVRFYLDGALVGVSTGIIQTMDSCAGSSVRMGIHWQGDPLPFKGKMDEVRLYNRALTPSEVGAICSVPPVSLCTGTLGAPVVDIDFGTGANPTPPLELLVPGANTSSTYKPVTGNPAQPTPLDGDYTITNNIPFNDGWFSGQPDHTLGDLNGNMIFFNSSVQPGEFYRQVVNGLCANTNYEFAAWIANAVDPKLIQGVLPDLTFQIEKTDGTVLGTFNTGGVAQSASFTWKQYGFLFTTPAGVSSVVLKLINNNVGGIDQAGNDLAIDDISFRPCGPLLQASFDKTQLVSSTSQCSNRSLSLYGTISDLSNNPAFKWQVSADSGVSWTDIANSNSLEISWAIASLASDQSYRFRLLSADPSAINAATCRIISETIELTAHGLPSGNLSGEPACAGFKPMLTYTPSSGVGAAFALVIQEGDVSNPERTVVANTPFSAINDLSVNTVYSVLSIKDENGCINAAPGISFNLSPKPLPDASFNPLQACINDSARIEFRTTYSNIPLDFSYTDGTKTVTILEAYNGSVIALPTLLTSQTTIQILSLYPHSGDGCIRNTGFNPTVINFPVSPAPAIQFNPMLPVCEGTSPIPITGASETSGLIGNGIYSGNFVTNGVFDPIASGPGNHPVRYTFTATNGCSSFEDQVVPVASLPEANAGPDLVTCVNTPLQLKATGGSNYSWSPATGLSDPGISNPVLIASGPVKYIVTVINDAGCIASDTISISVAVSNKTGFSLPNAFTPNGDGKNDCFGLQHWGVTSKVDFKVFNRWGQLVFSTQDGSKCWDGTLSGKQQKTGTYVYTVSAITGCGPIQLKGVINLLR